MTAGRGEEDRGDMLQSLRIQIKKLAMQVERTNPIGTVVETDYKKGKVKVKIGGNTTGWIGWALRRAGPDKEWWAPEKDEQVILAAPGGNLTRATIIGSIWQNKFEQNADNEKTKRMTYADGTRDTYERGKGRFIELAGGCKFTVVAGGTTMVVHEGGVDITGGQVTHNGKNIGSDHRHTQSGGAGLGGIPA